MEIPLILVFLIGMGILLGLILALRMNAFVAMLIASIAIGLLSGMSFDGIIENISLGMGNTLAFVGVVVGMGSIFGAILEHSGATQKLSTFLLQKFKADKVPIGLSVAGFFIAIPVFFDVAFIILVPMIYALQRNTGKSLLYFAIPLLSGLAVTHAFIPPTPGPIAVANILQADLGWVILFGFMVGIPTTWVSGVLFGKFISKKIILEVPSAMDIDEVQPLKGNPGIASVFIIILLPLLLILLSTVLGSFYVAGSMDIPQWVHFFHFIGHPFSALIISTLVAMYFLGIKYGATLKQLQSLSTKALAPAGVIILITGAGGVFKQMLIETGVGLMLAEQMTAFKLTPILTGYIIAIIIRVLQGSSTVAMITAAGMVAPLLQSVEVSPMSTALIVLSIAAGASGFSHVNDSGFWLVNRYLGMTERQTLKTWTLMTGILSVTGLVVILLLSLVVG